MHIGAHGHQQARRHALCTHGSVAASTCAHAPTHRHALPAQDMGAGHVPQTPPQPSLPHSLAAHSGVHASEAPVSAAEASATGAAQSPATQAPDGHVLR